MSDIKYEYTYDVDELDDILVNLQNGIEPSLMNDELRSDLKARLQEHKDCQEEEGMYSDDPTLTTLTDKIKATRRRASTSDVVIIKLSDIQKQTIIDDMSQSIVRSNPNSIYNHTDDMLYSSTEKKLIYQKLNGLSNIYYNQAAYQNAIKTIIDAIEYSIKNDFPMYTEQQVRELFSTGKLKYQRPIPKLYINHVTEITDKDILRGIATGQINVVDKKNQKQPKRKNNKRCLIDGEIKTVDNCEMMSKKLRFKEELETVKRNIHELKLRIKNIKDKTNTEFMSLNEKLTNMNERSEILVHQINTVECVKDVCSNYGINFVDVDYTVIGDTENKHLLQLHRQGFETEISPAIRMSAGIYRTTGIPSSSIFNTKHDNETINPKLINFDWTQPDAGKIYYEILTNKKYTTNDLITSLSNDNADKLTPLFRSRMQSFLGNLNRASRGDYGYDYSNQNNNNYYSSLEVDDRTLKMEQNILEAMRNYNINNNNR